METIKEIQKLTLAPDEYLLVSCQKGTTWRAIERLQDSLKQIFGEDNLKRMLLYIDGDVEFKKVKISDIKEKKDE